MFYQYHIMYFDEFEDDDLHEEGILFAEDWHGAMEGLLRHYGEDLVSILRLMPIDTVLDRGTLDRIKWDLRG